MVPIADQIWEITASHAMPGGIVFPLRCTVIRLHDGLWVHSPLGFTDAQAAAIEAEGPVTHLVGPSRMHDLHLAAAAARWPGARVAAPPSVLEAKGLDGDDVRTASWPGIRSVALRGTDRTQEVVFVHEASRTLLVTDLVFHFGPAENWPTGVLRWAIGCRERLAASRSWRYVFADDMAALAASVEEIFALDFDRLVPCHGAVVATDAKARLREALAGRIP